MDYQTLFLKYEESEKFKASVPLVKQPYYAAVALVLALLFISGAVSVTYTNRSVLSKFPVYFLLTIVASLFSGAAIVFASNSFGVYV